jgi:non-ribosomal peptide synthetase component E (peptide arylation enzyme)
MACRFHVEAYDDAGLVLPRGQVGEAGVRGPSSCSGYYPGLGSTESKYTSDGAYLTGDLIVRDDEGFVRVVGRKKDQIIRGGTNIDAAEVETALSRHPDVLEVVCIGTPHERLGEQLMAVITIRGAQAPTLEGLAAFLDSCGLAKFKWPEHLWIVDQFPRTASQKINKAKVRSMIAELSGTGTRTAQA